MDYNAVMTAIQTLGFPIVAACALALFCYNILKRFLEQNEKREAKLYEKIDECQKINKLAIETIASYAEKLDIIEDSITEMRTDITVIKTRMEQ